MQKYIKENLEESIEVKKRVVENLIEDIKIAAEKIIESYRRGGNLFLFGNGGSAADAQHISTELMHQFEIKGRTCILALALSTNSSALTAIGNDWDFGQVFERQVEGLATKRDVVIGITTSGNSNNIIKGIEQAKKNGAFTIALTGCDGGKIKGIADLSIIVPSKRTARIQEAHITIGHILCGLIENELFKEVKV